MTSALTPTLVILRTLLPDLRRLHGVRAISVFGSRARGDARDDSDLDLLIDFEPDARPTFFALAAIDRTIERAVGLKSHTVPRDALNPRYAPHILSDLVPV